MSNLRRKKTTDPEKKGTKRVYKDAADKKRQKNLEGKDTKFQNALRSAEAEGRTPFDFEGKSYAARTKAKPAGKAPKTKRATGTTPSGSKPKLRTIPAKKTEKKAEGTKKRRAMGSSKITNDPYKAHNKLRRKKGGKKGGKKIG